MSSKKLDRLSEILHTILLDYCNAHDRMSPKQQYLRSATLEALEIVAQIEEEIVDGESGNISNSRIEK